MSSPTTSPKTAAGSRLTFRRFDRATGVGPDASVERGSTAGWEVDGDGAGVPIGLSREEVDGLSGADSFLLLKNIPAAPHFNCTNKIRLCARAAEPSSFAAGSAIVFIYTLFGGHINRILDDLAKVW